MSRGLARKWRSGKGKKTMKIASCVGRIYLYKLRTEVGLILICLFHGLNLNYPTCMLILALNFHTFAIQFFPLSNKIDSPKSSPYRVSH